MTFTGDGTNLLHIIVLFANSIKEIVLSLDNIQFLDAPFSLFDVIIAIVLIELIFWFILRVITSRDSISDSYSGEAGQYRIYGETMETSSETIDGEEILHE